jgi:DHA3 family macrolide efflux protein-like MFS transporter
VNNSRKFSAIWIGECVSTLGSSMLSFALGVWVYQQTGSAADFGLVIFFAALPQVLFAPIAGVLVDRWPRQRLMLMCNLGAALCSFALLMLAQSGALGVSAIYALVLLGSLCGCTHQIAYSAWVTTLFADESARARANGMVQLGFAVAFVAGPAIAGSLLPRLGLASIILLDCCGFLAAAFTLAVIRLPDLARKPREVPASFLFELRAGLRYIHGHSGLGLLLLIAAVSNFSVGFVQVLFTPMVLAATTQDVLGVLVSLGGVGMVLGGIACTLWGIPKQPLHAVVAGLACGGLCLLVGAQRAAVALWAISIFVYFVMMPLINASLQSLWQRHVPKDLQGRAFAVRNMISFVTLPFAYVISPWLAQRWFEPSMMPDGALAASMGRWIGAGPGRGMALMFMLAGVAQLILAAIVAAKLKSGRADFTRDSARTVDAPLVAETNAP